MLALSEIQRGASPGNTSAARNGAQRRRSPRPTDTDWLVLRGLGEAVRRLAALIARPGMRALDIGCGTRPYEPIFTELGLTYAGADFHGADILIDPDGHVRTKSASYDLVLSFQVLEHVRDLETYLSEAHRLLREGGHLLLSTHGSWLYHPHPEDHRRWTREGLVAELARHGFGVRECVPIVGPLAWTTMIRLTCACFALRQVPWVGTTLAQLLSLAMNARGVLEDAITPAWVTRDNACVYAVLCTRDPS
jgi:SAM-dependent methyltransferase